MVVILLALAALVISARRDLSHLAIDQGAARLQAGDVPGAEVAFHRAIALGSDAAPLAYNLGVGLYRVGAFAKAGSQFATTLATAGPALAAVSHYNRGNCLYREAERLAADDRDAARRFLQEAIADYGQALALAPGAGDAGSNLSLARSRLAALGSGPAQTGGQPGAGQGQKGRTGAGAKAGSRQTANASPQAAAGAAQQAERADPAASAGKTRRDLTRQEAERLLNDARGRERPTGMLHGGGRNEQMAKPEKDW